MAESWLLLTVSTAGAPDSLRVQVWRRLRSLGALYLQQGVCLLPARPETTRALDRLAARVRHGGGTARLLHITMPAPEEEAAVIAGFQAERAAEYQELLDRLPEFTRELAAERTKGRLTYAEVEESEADLARFQRWIAKIAGRDYFNCPLAEQARSAVARCADDLASFEAGCYAICVGAALCRNRAAEQPLDSCDNADIRGPLCGPIATPGRSYRGTASGTSGQGFLDSLHHRRIIRRRARRKTRQHPPVLAHQELLEVPGNVARELRPLTRQQSVQRMALRPVDLQLGTQREAHPVVEAAELLNFLFAARLLPGKLVARKAKHVEALVLVILVEVLQGLVLRREATLGGNVDHQHHLALERCEGQLPAVQCVQFQVVKCTHDESPLRFPVAAQANYAH